MDRTMRRNERIRREQRATRMLMALAAVVLFCGLFAQIAVRAQVSEQAKEIAAVEARMHLMRAEMDNLNLCINQHHNLNSIGERALALGMEQPTEDRVRVVSLPAMNTPTQTVANVSDTEING